MKLKRFVGQMEKMPKGYGRAYICFDRMGAICYPIPLNWIVGICHQVWFRLAIGFRGGWEQRLLEERANGRREGILSVQRVNQDNDLRTIRLDIRQIERSISLLVTSMGALTETLLEDGRKIH